MTEYTSKGGGGSTPTENERRGILLERKRRNKR
jgi:hypothetical protein